MDIVLDKEKKVVKINGKSFPYNERNCGGHYEVPIQMIIGACDEKLYLLDDIFFDDIIDGKPVGWHGATYISMRTLTDYQIEERKNEPDDELWRNAVANGYTDCGLQKWWKKCCADAIGEGLLYPFDDDSFRAEVTEIYEDLTDEEKEILADDIGVRGEDFAEFDCGGCGRCGDDFVKTFHEANGTILNQELLDLIEFIEH